MRESENSPPQRNQSTTASLPPRLGDDQFYRALSSPQRRRLLHYLLDHEECNAAELASVLSGWEATTTGTMVDSSDRSAIHLKLRHNDLPRLAEAGLIAYDTENDTVQIESLHSAVTHVIRQSVEAEERHQSG